MKAKTLLNFIAIAIISIGLISCKEKPACEKNNTGSVKIYNNYGIPITVDVYSDGLGGDGFAGERNVSNGGSVTYSGIPSGYIEIWETDAYDDWGYWEGSCYQCDTYEFEIYKKKKSATIFLSEGTLLNVDEKLKGEKKISH